MRAIITGASGFIGRALVKQISQPVVLTRAPDRTRRQLPGVEVHGWDPLAGPPPAAAFRDVEAVFHLAGEPIADERWTAAKKQRIRDSRVIGTANLVRGLAELDQPPPVLISASAIGYYGSRGDQVLDESSPPAEDFLAEVCAAWEEASARAAEARVRVVNPRIGVVLGRGGGALAKMLLPFRLGLGGRLGDGRQWMSWVHVDDVVGVMLHAAAHESVAGPLNAVAPAPVTNREFTRVLASVVRRPAVFPVPALALRLALGQFSEVLLASQRVLPTATLRCGYQFAYPNLDAALRVAVAGAAPSPAAPVASHR